MELNANLLSVPVPKLSATKALEASKALNAGLSVGKNIANN